MRTTLNLIPALCLGLVSFLWLFGWERAVGLNGPFAMPYGDLSQHIAGAYAYLDGDWAWPIFRTDRLNHPEGLNIIFTDSAPFAGLVAKIVNTVTGVRWNYLGSWFLVLWVGQAVGGAYLALNLGVKSKLALLFFASLALGAFPFLSRYGHLALSSHFLILIALGLYFRTVHSTIIWIFLNSVALLTHPYLFAMCFPIFVATVIDRILRRDLSGKRGGVSIIINFAAIAIVAYTGGYLSTGSVGTGSGFGLYSMNLLSPIWPVFSAFFGGDYPKTTGGQYEGLQYLGAAGIVICILAAITAGRQNLFSLPVRYPALTILIAGFTAYALVGSVWVGERQITSMIFPQFPPFTIFRVGGRFFWPVGYLMVFVSAAYLYLKLTFLAPAKVAMIFLAFAAGAQALEARGWFVRVEHGFVGQPRPKLMAEIQKATSVVVFPGYSCIEDEPHSVVNLGQIVWMAAQAGAVIDTAHVARENLADECDNPLTTTGDLLVLLPGKPVPPSLPPASCRPVEEATVCPL